MFAAGHTMNVSLDGICVTSQHVPWLGSLIAVEVDLPRIVEPRPGTGLNREEIEFLPLHGEGRVIWRDVAQSVFAALIWFRTLDTAGTDE